MKQKTKTYLFFILFTLAVGGLSALLTMGNMDIYDKITTPPFAPPSIVFPIAWGILYVLMGISASMIYLKGKEDDISVLSPLFLYYLQLTVNFFWSIIFFNMQNFLFSLIWLLLLLVLVVVQTRSFYRISKLAAYLQIPYILWLVFAAVLNYSIFILNV
jgi:tryptophan-rich sensory protein